VTGASATGALTEDITGGSTWVAVIAGALSGSDTLTDRTLIDLTLAEDDFVTPADGLCFPDGRTVADRSCRVDGGAGSTGAPRAIVGFGFTFVTTYEFRNSSAGSGLRFVSM
jgi:hypothetical protein